MELTVDELKALLTYDPITGDFRWNLTPKRTSLSRVAGCVDTIGYLIIRIRGKGYKAHRLAWLYMHGEWPKQCLDHINGVRSDNRMENLREVSTRENSQNKGRHRAGKAAGITAPCRNHPKWTASIMIKGKSTYLGSFLTEQEAHEIYSQAVASVNEGREPIKRLYKTKGYSKEGNKYRANYWKNGKLYWLGIFPTAEEAHQAHLKAKEDLNSNE
jgi:hypothetical protein